VPFLKKLGPMKKMKTKRQEDKDAKRQEDNQSGKQSEKSEEDSERKTKNIYK